MTSLVREAHLRQIHPQLVRLAPEPRPSQRRPDSLMTRRCVIAGQSGIPVFEILLVRGIMVLSISYMKAVTSTQHTFPHALGKRYAFIQ